MPQAELSIPSAILDEYAVLSLEDLSRVCAVEAQRILDLVEEGILNARPAGMGWHFSGTSVRRARLALRLQHDLEINLAGVALALQLLDDIDELRRELRRRG
jgi:chaperone modulatory protein CbpM